MNNKKIKEEGEGKRRRRKKEEEGGGRRKWRKKKNNKPLEKLWNCKTRRKPNKTRKRTKKGARTGRTPNPPKRTHVWMAHFCVLFVFSTGSSEPLEKLCFRVHTRRAPRKLPFLSKIKKTLGRGIFKYPVCLGGANARPRNPPFFLVFPEGAKMGFNCSPLNCQRWGSIKHP